jgi:hypothetical protein
VASLQVGDLVFGFMTVRTESYRSEPVFDSSGKHYVCHKITLDVAGLVSSVAIATGRANPRGVGIDNEGDALPRTLYQLTDYLTRPRQVVEYSIGDQIVLSVPRKEPDGTRLSCDARGGPIPHRAQFTAITGEKTAFLQFGVTCFDSRSSHVLLSNSYDVYSSIDSHGYTTRTVRGEAHFRKDFIDAVEVPANSGITLQPDDFRRALMVPVPSNMRRHAVEVEQPAGGDSVFYTVVDRENNLGLSTGDFVVSVSGSMTGGWDQLVADPKSALRLLGGLGQKALERDLTGALGMVFNSMVPKSHSYATVRVTGRRGVDRGLLGKVAVSFLLDRLGPTLKKLMWIPSFFITHSIETDGTPPWCEARMTTVASNPYELMQFLDGTSLFNLTPTVAAPGGFVVAASNLTKPALPAGGGTRGTWVARMVSAALLPPDEDLPGPPPAEQNAIDFPNPV